MNTFDSELAKQFLDVLVGGNSDNSVFDFRAIHDKDKSALAHAFRGTLETVKAALDYYNSRDYGIFVVINELDGRGNEVANVKSIRANWVDLDHGDIAANYARAMRWELKPQIIVISSPGRAHLYWRIKPHNDVARFTDTQRRLITLFEGDPVIIDGPRVMRLPGSVHNKTAQQHRVGLIINPETTLDPIEPSALEWALSGIDPNGSGGIDTFKLGENVKLYAPSLEWATYALDKIDPTQLDRGEWLKLTAAFKAASWQSGEDTIRLLWDLWCARYPENDPKENEKLWRSIKETKTGWNYLMQASGVEAEFRFGGKTATMPVQSQGSGAVLPPMPGAQQAPAGLQSGSGILNPIEQVDYFKGCILVKSLTRVLAPDGRLYDAGGFNAAFGGKVFVIDMNGKTTDEPWKAATRGQVYQVPKVDGLRFLPQETPGALLPDEFGRMSVNVYKPPIIDLLPGDVTLFLRHMHLMLPTERDVRIMLSYLAHCVQRPGKKVFWAPLIQSEQGAGKGIIKLAMTYALGSVYVHAPNAKELVDSGGKFTGWMRNKLMIIADEIKVDDKRDMIEVLKPMITEERIEIQGKGADQIMDDNPANWVFFTNYKDAIPVTSNDRRYAIIYSPIQSVDDLQRLGMTGDYFPKLYAWMRADGRKHVASFLKHYPIDPEFDPDGNAHRAPVTSSMSEAIIQSRGRIEQIIMEAVEGGVQGFRGGWLSSAAVARLMREEGVRSSPHSLKKAFEGLGYKYIARANRPYFQEENKQPHLHNLSIDAKSADYANLQGYGDI